MDECVMMVRALTKEELDKRSKETLIRYAAQLQEELRAVYEKAHGMAERIDAPTLRNTAL